MTYQPAHVAARSFPATAAALAAWDAVILSDVGANALLLHPDTFARSPPRPDSLLVVRDYVEGGGGLIMVGGYLTFAGIEGKARDTGTPVEEVLPGTISPGDDRVERPAGALPRAALASHPILAGVPEGEWPALLGHNRVAPKPGAEVVAPVGSDPLIVAGAPRPGPRPGLRQRRRPPPDPTALRGLAGYAPLWAGMAAWVAGRA